MPPKVIGFYDGKSEFHVFSNFWTGSPFLFLLPEFARCSGLPDMVFCKFSEKAIMLVKAALMKDTETFQKIRKATDPRTVKGLGRSVSPWNQELWDTHLEDVAFEVVRQKFAANKELQNILLSTGDHILAEATRKDCIWGIGLDVGDVGVQDPTQWRGRNVLGSALMKARDHLRRGVVDDKASSPPSRPASSPSIGVQFRSQSRSRHRAHSW